MSAPAGHLLVLGIGNVLLRDEGVGVHLLHEVERRAAGGVVALPRETRLVDGGTAGLGLLPLLAGARAVLLLDATDLRVAPGVVTVLRGDALGSGGGATRPVQRGGMGDLLAAARLAGVLPAAVALVGVQPDDVASGLLLSAAVRSALPVAAAAAIAELERLDLEAADADAPSFAPGLEMGGSAA